MRAFTARALAYYAMRDLVPLYAVYALLFRDSGVSPAEVSTLFVVWSVAAFVFEVPSGAWADTVDRRSLLLVSSLVHAGGFACWVLFPGYAGFAAGFVLWGLSSALMSGTFEALVFEELDGAGQAASYPRLMGHAHALAMTANLLATVSAAPLMAWGGYALVGWTSVAIAVVQAALALTFPRRGRPRAHAVHDLAVQTERIAVRYVAMLRAGVREASGATDVRRAVLIAAAVVGASAYDEYFPLVARHHGVAAGTVPWLIGLVVLGQVVGTVLAGRTAAMRGKWMGWLLLGAALLISAGALVAPPLGFVAIAVGYGLLNNAMVVSEARIQAVITGPARATVTSVAGLATEVVALAVYVSFAATAATVSVPAQVAALGVPLALVALLARRRLPAPRPQSGEAASAGEDGPVDSAPWQG
ncbi:MAG: MFS transporter [Nocardioides sp.]